MPTLETLAAVLGMPRSHTCRGAWNRFFGIGSLESRVILESGHWNLGSLESGHRVILRHNN